MADIKYDISKIMAEYGDNDFGFTTVDEEEYNSIIAEKDETVEEYKIRSHILKRPLEPLLYLRLDIPIKPR